ncbi:ATP-binding protein [Micromonospora sp. NPDC126480]|uniref:ATP-binding protein n=1 Tax=Micromonospora sp. NPDC126480 TaxID=3155312 RepID=UPI003325BF43
MDRADRPGAGASRGGQRRAVLPTDVRCLVETDESSGVVRLSGVLDPPGTGRVRDALLGRLVDRPGPLVADLTGLRVTDPALWEVFGEVRRAVHDWPAADLLLCDPTGAVSGAPAWPTLDGALAALAATPLAAVLTVDLPPVVGSARQARQLVCDGCARWGVAELTEPGCIAVTELVNNAVAHARTPMTVRLAPRDSTLHLAVRDHSSRLPAFTGLAPLHTAGGRGLLLIDTVARRWGATPVPDGKVVWCVLHPDDQT